MYKSQLQELCQGRQWALPEYAVTRDGPDHKPSFLASVTVNGDHFTSSVSSSSSKEAQNQAAKVAFEKLSSAAPPPAPSQPPASFGVLPPSPSPSPEGIADDVMYKSLLQVLCQRRKWALPQYAVTRDGPDHSPCFRASVTVNGHQFSSSVSSSSSKEAQGKAAKVAFEKLSSAAPPPAPSLPQASFGVGDQLSSSVPSSFSKEAQNKADQVTFENLSSAAPPPAPSLPRSSFSQPSLLAEASEGHMYKFQLQVLCQRRRWALPEYTVTRDGSDHNPRFRASVAVNGDQFSSTVPSNSSKEAHNKAAQVALEKLSAAPLPVRSLARSSSSCPSLVTEACENQHLNACLHGGPSQQEDPGFYKNLLQELTQKEGLSLPIYNTDSKGKSHVPIFSSIVEIEGERFEGEAAKTKKHAETNAAKVAWNTLKERNKSGNFSSGFPPQWQVVELEMPSSKVPLNIQKTTTPSPKVDKDNLVTDNHVAATLELVDAKNTSFMTKNMNDNCFNNPLPVAPSDENISLKKHDASTTVQESNPITYAENENALDNTLLKDGSSSPTRKPICSNDVMSATTTGNPSEDSHSLSSFRRVQVYPRKPDMVLPEDGVMLPFSDDTWVALGLGA